MLILPQLIAFPLVSYNDETYIFSMDDNDNKYASYTQNKLIIPPLFREYLYHIFNAWPSPFDKYSITLEDTFWTMLFYRDYSRNAQRDL
jgi:hypothetical protein